LFKSAKKTIVSVTVKELAEQAQIKPKILLVEDSIPIRTQMKRILETAGYEVTTAVDGEDGFNKLRAGSFNAVVSDVQMPNLDGLELVAKIRQFQEYTDLPVILVTTLASQEDKRQGRQAGANAYITKGDFEQGVLLDTLRSLI
jgi:two-component system chemotaxis sensor kinase CheA